LVSLDHGATERINRLNWSFWREGTGFEINLEFRDCILTGKKKDFDWLGFFVNNKLWLFMKIDVNRNLKKKK